MPHARSLCARLVGALASAYLLSLVTPDGAAAADQVVSDCSTDADLRAKLTAMQGEEGTLTFDCGAAPVTLLLTDGVAPDGELPLIFKDVIVDSGGTVTLSGAISSRIFQVAGAGALTLRRLHLTQQDVPAHCARSNPGDGA